MRFPAPAKFRGPKWGEDHAHFAIDEMERCNVVGQPFLRDHELVGLLDKDAVGPVHLIGCHRSVTEAQAMKQLGFPDATIVSPPFGVYVADPIQRIQILFLANCRDDTTTRHALQRAFEWLLQTGEDQRLAARAAIRTRIVKTIALEDAQAAQLTQHRTKKPKG